MRYKFIKFSILQTSEIEARRNIVELLMKYFSEWDWVLPVRPHQIRTNCGRSNEECFFHWGEPFRSPGGPIVDLRPESAAHWLVKLGKRWPGRSGDFLQALLQGPVDYKTYSPLGIFKKPIWVREKFSRFLAEYSQGHILKIIHQEKTFHDQSVYHIIFWTLHSE